MGTVRVNLVRVGIGYELTGNHIFYRRFRRVNCLQIVKSAS